MRLRVIWLATALLLFIFGCAPKEEVPRLIPMEDFFRNPEKAAFSLSPDGGHIAWMQPWSTRLNIHVYKIGEEKVTRITNATERDIVGYMWANNSRIAFVQDSAGDENYKLYTVNIDGTNEKELTPFEKVQVRLIDRLENDDEHMLITMNKRDPRVFDVYHININTGQMDMIVQNPGNVVSWLTDHEGNLRVARATDGVNTVLLYRDSDKDPFQILVRTNFKESLSPIFFTFDNKNLYVVSNIGRDKAAIYEYDVKTKEHIRLIYEHPEVDVSGLLRSNKRKKITGVVYITDKRHYHFFDQEREQLQRDLEERLPRYEVVITSMSKDEEKALVRAYSDRSFGGYYYFNRETKEFLKLADISPWIKEEEMAEMKPITYRSRDGLTIHGYLTLPKGLKPKRLPAIINPHGGPWARNTWGYNPEVQFLANRGYAVLQMNFRTSSGYGRQFWEAGFKQWGLAIQNDISDGVKWLISKGIADPKRVGIYGVSYGGYATLAGLAFTPDLYACGVDYVGISNIFSMLQSIPPYWKPYLEMMYEMIGHPEQDRELLVRTSPVYHADEIKAPLFVAQGANDPRVPKAESDQIVGALRKRGIDVLYMVKENEGHGFANEENRFDFYGAMEKFLAKHLGGRAEGQIQD
jgi:dipeptidyl aminopeptidase/acylaminoacyl peptidase